MKKRPYIGCSGFAHLQWKDGVFYPEGLSQERWLEYYATKFDTVELSFTYYRVPDGPTFIRWGSLAPDGFKFAVVGSKLITDIQEMDGVDTLIAQFVDRMKLLDDRLGPVLWKVPPSMKADRMRLKGFVKSLKKFKDIKHAFQFENESWLDEKIFKVLRDEGMSVVLDGDPEKDDLIPRDFAFTYERIKGKSDNEARQCSAEELKNIASTIKKDATRGREAFIYFVNDPSGLAPDHARQLKDILGLNGGGKKKPATNRKKAAKKKPAGKKVKASKKKPVKKKTSKAKKKTSKPAKKKSAKKKSARKKATPKKATKKAAPKKTKSKSAPRKKSSKKKPAKRK